MKRSFSLIELLVGMTLFALLASLLMGLYIGVSKNTAIQKKQEQRLEELIFLRTILQKSLGQAILEGISEGLYE
ncbi:MAG: prepilin-type N-terminal cleavage/methylation domain-containing protein, partial [Chlamydiota bacterium]